MPSLPGPYQVEINYSTAARSHKMRLDCQLSTSPPAGADLSTLNVITSGGANVGLTSAVGSLITLMLPFVSDTMTFNDFTLWKFVTGTQQRTFIGTAQIAIVGTNVNGSVPAHYSMFTMRTQNGGIAKVVLLEDVSNGNTKLPYSLLGTAAQDLFDYMTGDDTWIYARDNSYPVAPLFRSEGQNEALWRKIYRNQ